MNEAAATADTADRALLQRMAEGDRAALETLYRGYHGRLCRFLSRLTRRPELIEEVVNDCMFIAWQHAGEFRGDARVSTWLMGIAYRCGLKALRRQGTGPIDELADEALLPDLDGGSDPAEDRELRDLLGKALEHLTADQRVVVELVYGIGHSLNEVAAIVQCPVGTVKARLFHARVKLLNVMPALSGEAKEQGG
ncbi:MAG TPA: sigma-70 family RNA polymerase sigma factor [Luteimonas sp.]|jgi:RNA polymerase sigma-70 factor (ECF subfamily)|nr:sigma-70 family RNA polymerase sigma factor [Luteimonas sp.]